MVSHRIPLRHVRVSGGEEVRIQSTGGIDYDGWRFEVGREFDEIVRPRWKAVRGYQPESLEGLFGSLLAQQCCHVLAVVVQRHLGILQVARREVQPVSPLIRHALSLPQHPPALRL